MLTLTSRIALVLHALRRRHLQQELDILLRLAVPVSLGRSLAPATPIRRDSHLEWFVLLRLAQTKYRLLTSRGQISENHITLDRCMTMIGPCTREETPVLRAGLISA